MKQVNVALGENSYPIFIGNEIFSSANLFAPYLTERQVCVISNQVIADIYATQINAMLPKNSSWVLLPEGEPHKNHTTLNLIYDHLIANKYARDCVLVALGGGIVGDITGFAAATYQRGVDFIQLPTTLLAQVDSSVGGKTAINHHLGKNLIGAFYQPKAVFINTLALKTLPQREISAGLAEVIKYGFIRDANFLNYLETHLQAAYALDDSVLTEVIATACQHKADVVASDEKEQGLRATLNLGHTFGHAIETITSYKQYLHGEAVAIGTVMAAYLSKSLGYLSDTDVKQVERLLTMAHCPIRHKAPAAIAADIRAAMQRDKKVSKDGLKLILLEELGQAKICTGVDENKILDAIRYGLTDSE